MTKRFTVDRNGFVVSVEDVPERPPHHLFSKRSATKQTQKNTTAGKPQARQSHNPKIGVRPSTAQTGHTASSAKLVACLVCNALVRPDRIEKHLRKVHPDVKSGSSRPRPPQLKPPVPQSTGNPSMVLCSVCGVHVRKDRWDRHLARAHSAPTNVARGVQERSKQTADEGLAERGKAEIRGIDRKLKQLAPGFHRLEIEELQRQRAKLLKKLKAPKDASKVTAKRARRTRSGRAGGYSGNQEEALRLSRGEEGSYGGKYLGHMRRDSDGTFGSTPLYDDYSEESGA